MCKRIIVADAGQGGFALVAAEEACTDLLIGQFEPCGFEVANKATDFLRENNPPLGHKPLRDGQFTEIPVRQPLLVMVCDGYSAFGDSAFMTMPLIGSGIANSFKAARMLADTVIADKAGAYSASVSHWLWQYIKIFASII